MKAQYKALPDLDQSDPLFAEPQSPELIDHHRGGPSQVEWATWALKEGAWDV